VDFQVTWTQSASDDPEAIVTHIAQANPAAAEKTGDAILKHVEVLRTFPQIGPRYPKDPHGRIREILCGKYRIFYRVTEESHSVQILTIWHSARDEPYLP
jgi:plasmid stabilization system protein ParE